jgi:diaminobutyrate-2-oxoglutarate transaminase
MSANENTESGSEKMMKHMVQFQKTESEVRYYCRDTPNLFVSARGARVWDNLGTEFIDFLAGCGSLNYGHNHPAIKAALLNYLLRDGIGNALDFHTEAKLGFLEAFTDTIMTPRKLDYRLQFTGPTGANCVEAALKLARKVTGRATVAAFTNGFHGMSMGALAATGSHLPKRGIEGLLQHVVRLPFEGYLGSGIEELERFSEMAGDPSGGVGPVAAIIVETIQGEGGLNAASDAWLRKLAEVAKNVGALLIVDDIQAGCGRTGDFFSFERAGIVPDVVCLSKSIGGGLPMSLLLVKPEFDLWRPGEHSGTFRGNSLAFVAATAALSFWSDCEFLEGLQERSRYLASWCDNTVLHYPDAIVRGKGRGMMQGIEFASAANAKAVADGARRKGVLLETCGPSDQVLKVFAPLNIDFDLFREGLCRIEAAIEEAIGMASPSRHKAA